MNNLRASPSCTSELQYQPEKTDKELL